MVTVGIHEIGITIADTLLERGVEVPLISRNEQNPTLTQEDKNDR